MSRNLCLVGIGLVAVLLIATYLYMPTQGDGFSFGFGVIGEDANGSPVTIPFSWWINGVEVTKLRTTVSWSASGSSLDWSTLFISGRFTIYRLDYQGRNPMDITPADLSFERHGLSNQEGDTSFSLFCDVIVDGVDNSGKDANYNKYWHIQVSVTMTGFVKQLGSYGEDLSDTFTDSLTFTIKWIDGSFTLQGGIE